MSYKSSYNKQWYSSPWLGYKNRLTFEPKHMIKKIKYASVGARDAWIPEFVKEDDRLCGDLDLIVWEYNFGKVFFI
jgi:hypothetical protein